MYDAYDNVCTATLDVDDITPVGYKGIIL